MKFLEFIKLMLSSRSGISSKRVCGCFAWIIIAVCSIYATFSNVQTPEILNTIIYASVILLGVDSVTGIWKK